MSLTDRLRVAREAAGMTQTSVSALSGIAVSNLSSIENGNRDVRLSTLTRLLDALDLEVRFVPRGVPMTLEAAISQSNRGRRQLADVGLSPSNPEERLNAKQRRGIDVSVERAVTEVNA
jgi:transcriptional regulator with XRE-family HTH domain